MRRKMKKYAAAALAAVLLTGSLQSAAVLAEPIPEEAVFAMEEMTDTEFLGDVSESGSEDVYESFSESFPENEEESEEPAVFDDGEIDIDAFLEAPEQAELFVDEVPTEELSEEAGLAGEINGNAGYAVSASAKNGVSDNRDFQNYSVWTTPMTSYLAENEAGYLRVEYLDEKVLVEQYNKAFEFQFRKYIKKELPDFGGFYAGKNAYYLVFGQSNMEEDNGKEVVRVVKYDKNWKRLGAASLRGANSTTVFQFGSVRIAEYGGMLYVRTCHEMYKGSDGYRHQTNMTIQIRTSDMRIMDNKSIGYVSHSLNQFILVDDRGKMVTLDHGDAYDRGGILQVFDKTAGDVVTDRFVLEKVLEVPGRIGDNSTGASLGGLEYSDTSYLTAGNLVADKSKYQEYGAVRNIFVTSTPKTDGGIQKGSTSVKWITNYKSSDKIRTTTPQLVKMGDNSFLLLWTQSKKGKWESDGKVYYVFLDGNGNPTSSIFAKNGHLSDCKPILSGGKAIWYITDGKKLTFCKVNQKGAFELEDGHLNSYEPEMKFQTKELTCGLIEGSVQNLLTAKTDGKITYSSSDTNIATVDSKGKVTLKALGSCTITAHASAGVNYAAKSISYKLNVRNLKTQTVKVASAFTRNYGDSSFSLNASCTAKSKLSYYSDNTDVATVSSSGRVSVKGVGKAVITVRAAATSEYASASAKTTITVKQKPIGKCQAILEKVGPVNPDYRVLEGILQVSDGNTVLKKGEDYEFSFGTVRFIGSTMINVDVKLYGCGNYSGTAAYTVAPIDKKSVLNSAAFTTKGTKLTWEKESGAVGYCIYRKDNDGAYKRIHVITNHNVTEWTDTSALKANAVYTYCVRAYTKKGITTVYASSSNRKTVIPAPVLKSVTKAGTGKLKISWNKVDGADGYVIYQKIGSSWKRLAVTKSTSYTHTNSSSFPVKTGATNTYTVKAYKKLNGKTVNGAYSKNGIKGKA